MDGDRHVWAVSRGITPYHPSEWSPEDRAAYAEDFGWAAPYSDTYRSCPCHPHGFARGQDDDVSEQEYLAWKADDPLRRTGFSRATGKALAYLHRWSYAYHGSLQAEARRRVLAALGQRAA